MTETEWLSATDPTPMLKFHERAASERKLRLFHVACCERVEHLLVDARSRSALACARRYADDQANADEWRAAAADARSAWEFSLRQAGVARYGAEFVQRIGKTSTGLGPELEVLGFDPAANATLAVWYAVERPYTNGLMGSASHATLAISLESGSEAIPRERQVQSQLVRCIFGNPFRPVTLDQRWQSETVVALATGIYAERAFDRMPILADAFEDAGCDHTDILDHCRGLGPHVRGCWVVDLCWANRRSRSNGSRREREARRRIRRAERREPPVVNRNRVLTDLGSPCMLFAVGPRSRFAVTRPRPTIPYHPSAMKSG